MNIFPKQRNFVNRKAIFFIAMQNKKDTVTQVSNDAENVPQSYVRNELASSVSNDNVTQNKASVNNTGTKFSLDVDRLLNDLRNAQLWQYDGYEHFFKAKKLYQQKSDIFHCHAK